MGLGGHRNWSCTPSKHGSGWHGPFIFDHVPNTKGVGTEYGSRESNETGDSKEFLRVQPTAPCQPTQAGTGDACGGHILADAWCKETHVG